MSSVEERVWGRGTSLGVFHQQSDTRSSGKICLSAIFQKTEHHIKSGNMTDTTRQQRESYNIMHYGHWSSQALSTCSQNSQSKVDIPEQLEWEDLIMFPQMISICFLPNTLCASS